MIFYSKITNKPNSIITEVRDGFRVVSRKKLCEFNEGKLETTDPELIKTLQKRPDLFRTDRPWEVIKSWKTEEEGIKLLKEGERLGIDCRHIRKEYLMQEIQRKLGQKALTPKGLEQIEPKEEIEESVVEKDTVVVKKQSKIDYKQLMKEAKKRGIKSFGIKKEVLEKALLEKEVK